MMNKGYKFIKTQDLETKKTLESLGYQLISFDGTTATFVNDASLKFEESNVKNTVMSNKLEF